MRKDRSWSSFRRHVRRERFGSLPVFRATDYKSGDLPTVLDALARGLDVYEASCQVADELLRLGLVRFDEIAEGVREVDDGSVRITLHERHSL